MKNKKSIKLFSSLLFTLVFLNGVAQTFLERTSNSEFYIQNVETNLFVSLVPDKNKEVKNGMKIILQEKQDGIFQRVNFLKVKNGFFQIQFVDTELNLDVHGCFDGKALCGTYKKENGAEIQVWNKNGLSEPHFWFVELVKDNKYRIVNKYSGKVLTARTKKKKSVEAIQWEWTNSDSQLWYIQK